MSDTLSNAEKRLFIQRHELADRLLPICEALKLAGYETAVIADIMRMLQTEPALPKKFSIVNNRYLVYNQDLVYDLVHSQALGVQPEEPKRMAIVFWL